VRLLGLDIATTTGAAMLDGERYLWARELRLEDRTSGLVFRNLRESLHRIVEEYGVEHVAVEQPLRTDVEVQSSQVDPGTGLPTKTRPAMKTFMRIYGLCAVAEEVCASQGVPFIYVNQMTWRKAFTGNPRATKEQSLAQARLIDKTIRSLDAAESLGVCWWLRGHLAPKITVRRGDLPERLAIRMNL
jgi:Holliday junction resolvasome RuvABC endonuclease subunit